MSREIGAPSTRSKVRKGLDFDFWHFFLPQLRYCDTRRAPTIVRLDSKYLQGMLRPNFHPKLFPRPEMTSSVDAAFKVVPWLGFLRTNGPELLESLGTVDRGLIDLCCFGDLVLCSITFSASDYDSSRIGSEATPGFDDMVFDELFASPSIDSEAAHIEGCIFGWVRSITRKICSVLTSPIVVDYAAN